MYTRTITQAELVPYLISAGDDGLSYCRNRALARQLLKDPARYSVNDFEYLSWRLIAYMEEFRAQMFAAECEMYECCP